MITNLINGKFYYGIHSTNNLNDGYLGGGIALKKAIKKHGRENFKKEIIADYLTRKEASDHEKLVVTKDLTKLEMCYNIKIGGDDQYRKPPSIISREKMRISALNRGEAYRELARQINTGNKNPMFGKKHTEEWKHNHSKAISGENHPNARKCIIFGIIYISRLEASKQLNIPKTTLHRRIDSDKPKWKDYQNYYK